MREGRSDVIRAAMGRRIRVLRVIPQLHSAGTANGMKRVVVRLDPRRYHVKVCGLFWWGSVGEDLRRAGIETLFLGCRPHSYGLTAIQSLVGVIRDFRPDIVHTHLDAGNIAGSVAAGLTRVGAVITNQQNANPSRGRLVRLFEYFLASSSRRIAAISYRSAQLHAKQIANPFAKGSDVDFNPPASGIVALETDPHQQFAHVLTQIQGKRVSGRRYYIIYATAPTDEMPFRREKREPRSLGFDGYPVIGNVARLTHQKGHRSLLEGLKKVLTVYPNARLVIVGDGPLREHLVRRCHTLGVERNVIFAGKRADIREILECLDVFVMPSIFEGCCTAALEAMAVGVPVVASAVGGLSETIIDGKTGSLVRPQDPDALAQAVVDTVHHSEQARQRALSARKRVELFFSADAAAVRTSALYEQVLDDPGAVA